RRERIGGIAWRYDNDRRRTAASAGRVSSSRSNGLERNRLHGWCVDAEGLIYGWLAAWRRYRDKHWIAHGHTFAWSTRTVDDVVSHSGCRRIRGERGPGGR